MNRPRKVIEAALLTKGFTRIEGDHHYFVYVTAGGLRSTIKTKTSHSPKVKDIGDNLLGKMAKQCKLIKLDFLSLIDCHLDQPAYEQKLVDQGEIEKPTA